MILQPTSLELVDAVIGFIETRAAPQLQDRDVFLARVAVNALHTIRREIQLGEDAEQAATSRLRALLNQEGEFTALNTALCVAIREGQIAISDPALLAHLRASVIDQVQIDQPNYSGLKAALAGA
jgi:hypothetical protein